ncbi:MAG: TIGR04086 family membrane protein [Clostridia bacterium]|nr:TIGR04086 family membrane protein [Clostridia bacterium]
MTERIKKGFWQEILTTVLFAVLISVILVLAFALLLRFVNIDGKIIVAVNQIIKAAGIVIAVFAQFKTKGKGVIKGAAAGIIYAVICGVLLGILGVFSMKHIFIDLGLLMAVGTFAGLIKAGK